ncbi:hypothetical protein OG266_01950 [Streptomyces sp. NBC_00554]|nr:hypothetical protein OG266_01950 [Streptomyces sp. NBC_00554]
MDRERLGTWSLMAGTERSTAHSVNTVNTVTDVTDKGNAFA